MFKRITSYLIFLISKKRHQTEPIVELDNEYEQISDVDQTELLMCENDYFEDYNPFEEKYHQFTDLVRGTRYERFAGKTTCLWAFESLLSDSISGKTGVNARYHLDSELYEEAVDERDRVEAVDNRRLKIDAYHINSLEFEVLKSVLEIAYVEARDPEECEYIRFDFKVVQNEDEVQFNECFHPYYSSYNTVNGNMYDDNIDTYGTSLGIMAVRSYLLYNTDSNEFIIADKRYWCY